MKTNEKNQKNESITPDFIGTHSLPFGAPNDVYTYTHKRNRYAAIMDGRNIIQIFTSIEATREAKIESCGQYDGCTIVIGAANIARHAANPHSKEANLTAADIKEMSVN